MTANEKALMERAMALAEQGRGHTSPNPMVGALVVRDGEVIGEGFHEAPGRDHAEIAAMRAAVGAREFAGRLRGATVVVTLEPCSHHGRTPPCADALVAAGVDRVVVGVEDPSARVNGAGLERLRAAGIGVALADGEVAHRLRRQNDAFRKHATHGLPFVTYKYAMTLDGRVATRTGDSKWISSPESRRRVHRLRAWSDAVMVGTGTLRQDDPQLTVRDVPVTRHPWRIVIDPRLELSPDAALFQRADVSPVVIAAGSDAEASRRRALEARGARVLAVDPGPDGRLPAGVVARRLAELDIQSVLLEGGPRLAASWWEEGLIDRVMAFVAPVVAGGGQAPGPLPSDGVASMADALRLRETIIEPSGPDVVISGYLREPY